MSEITITSGLVTLPANALVSSRASDLLDRFIFASLLSLVVLVTIPFGTVEPWWNSLYQCAIFGLGVLWLLEGFISGSWNLKQIGMVAPVAAFILFVFLQSVRWPNWNRTLSADPFETRLVFLKFLALAMNGFLLLRYVSSRRRLRSLIHVVIGVALASAMFGIARQALQQNEIGFILPYLHQASGFGQFVNKNHFAFLMEMATGLTTGFMFGGAVKGRYLLLYLSAVALMWIALALTNSRGGLLSMFAQIIFLISMLVWLRLGSGGDLTASSRTLRSFGVSAVGLCLLTVTAVGAIWIGGDVTVSRLESLSGEITTAAEQSHDGVRRREVWGATWQLIKAHPLTGSGFGAYGVVITSFHDGSGKWTPEAAHNDYLEMLASGGLVGLALVAWFGFTFIRRARNQLALAEPFRRSACLGALTGMFGVMAHSAVDFGLHVTANAVMFIALLVIATRDYPLEN